MGKGLLDLEGVEGMGIGIMHQCLEVVGSFCAGDVGACTPLKVAVASVGSFISVTPAIRMVGGEEDLEVEANRWKGNV